jgi:addiction module RelE/StbE family toxin
MRFLSWSPSFKRAFRRYNKRHPQARITIEITIRNLVEDPFTPSLDTHKLKGDLSGLWACSVAHDCRIVFEFISVKGLNEDGILLVDIGTHDEVY